MVNTEHPWPGIWWVYTVQYIDCPLRYGWRGREGERGRRGGGGASVQHSNDRPANILIRPYGHFSYMYCTVYATCFPHMRVRPRLSTIVTEVVAWLKGQCQEIFPHIRVRPLLSTSKIEVVAWLKGQCQKEIFSLR